MLSARGYLYLYTRQPTSIERLLLSFLLLFTMSNDIEAPRALNGFARESRALLGSCDGPALSEFIHDYFCGDDPIDSNGKWNECITLTVPYPMTIPYCKRAGGGAVHRFERYKKANTIAVTS